MVIVRDMWLTGFDAASLHIMYLDKPMRGHWLIQVLHLFWVRDTIPDVGSLSEHLPPRPSYGGVGERLARGAVFNFLGSENRDIAQARVNCGVGTQLLLPPNMQARRE